MDDPKFKIGQTIRYKFGSSEAVSRIKSIITQRNEWLYVASNPSGGGPIYISEKEIIKAI